MDQGIVFSFGLLLLAALLGGQLAYWLKLPRVTAYLLVGLLLGPHTLHLVTATQLEQLKPFDEMAMALVLFNMGCHFSFSFFRRILRRALRLSAGELLLTFILVTVGMFFATKSWQLAVLFGVLALATAPATTILVLKENDSEGPITEYAFALVAFNNLTAVVLFEAVLVAVLFFADAGATTPLGQLTHLGLDLLSSLILGGVGGFVVSYCCALMSRNRWLVLLIGLSTLLLGACDVLGIPHMLTFLAMGVTVANASEHNDNINAELDRVTGLLCVIFFVIHGAELQLRELIAAGMVGVVYIVTRSIGKWLGIYVSAGRTAPPQVRRWLGAALLSQAGAAIALSSLAMERAPEIGRQLQNIILGTVVFFEIVGPLLIRQSLLAAGEIPLDKAIRHPGTTPWIEFRGLWNRLLQSVGLDPWRKRSPDELTIADLMRKNFHSVPAGATFDALVSALEHSHDNVFPVTGSNGELIGVIDYQDLRDAVFDPNLGPLVCAADLARPPRNVLETDAPILEAWNLVRNSPDDLLPVVPPGERWQLVGMVARRDLYRFFLHRGGQRDDSH